MNILFLIQSFIPKEKYQEYMGVLQGTITSIRRQQCNQDFKIHITLSDDGSEYLENLAESQIKIISGNYLKHVRNIHSLDIDSLVLVGKSNHYNKGELFNYYLRQEGNNYDLIIFLDDDNPFVYTHSLKKFIFHFKNGYNFILGRLSSAQGTLRSFYDNKVQGTTFALTYNALKDIDFFGDRIKLWGCGEDSDIFWRIYSGYKNGIIKAVYDGTIITIDRISGRWKYCREKTGGIEFFKKDFYETYGIDPHRNPSRKKTEWITLEKNFRNIDESLFPFIYLDEYMACKKRFLYYKIIWNLRKLRHKISCVKCKIKGLSPLFEHV
ncbi:MAG: hypothetical protein ACMUJM_06450 [bacterium]